MQQSFPEAKKYASNLTAAGDFALGHDSSFFFSALARGNGKRFAVQLKTSHQISWLVVWYLIFKLERKRNHSFRISLPLHGS